MKGISKIVTFACVLSCCALTSVAELKRDVKKVTGKAVTPPEEQVDVEIIARFVAFPKEKIDEIVAANVTKPLTVDDLSTLLKQGDGRIISSPRVIAKSGNESIVRSAVVYRAPQDFDVEMSSMKGTNVAPFAISKPQDWEDFDIGATVVVTPLVSDDGSRINIEIQPQLTGEIEWETNKVSCLGSNIGKTNLDLVLPRIKKLYSNTILTMQSGSTVIVTGGMSDREEQEEIYVLLTCTTLNPGEPE